MQRVTTDDEEWWPPKGLVFGSHVYSWVWWRGDLQEVTVGAGVLQLVMCERETHQVRVFKDPKWRFPSCGFKAGQDVWILGLGERATGSGYYACSIVIDALETWNYLAQWEASIDWPNAGTIFGARTKRDAKELLRTYYTAVAEISIRARGFTGRDIEQHAPIEAEKMMQHWKFNRTY